MCLFPLSWSVHPNLCMYSERGWVVLGVHPPPQSPAWADFSFMMECTPEGGRCYSVYSVVHTHNTSRKTKLAGLQRASCVGKQNYAGLQRSSCCRKTKLGGTSKASFCGLLTLFPLAIYVYSVVEPRFTYTYILCRCRARRLTKYLYKGT